MISETARFGTLGLQYCATSRLCYTPYAVFCARHHFLEDMASQISNSLQLISRYDAGWLSLNGTFRLDGDWNRDMDGAPNERHDLLDVLHARNLTQMLVDIDETEFTPAFVHLPVILRVLSNLVSLNIPDLPGIYKHRVDAWLFELLVEAIGSFELEVSPHVNKDERQAMNCRGGGASIVVEEKWVNLEYARRAAIARQLQLDDE